MPTAQRPRRRLPARVYWRRRLIALMTLVTACTFLYYGITIVQALTNPSLGASTSARLAEWGRSNGFGGLVTWAENEYYRLHPAKVGGAPSSSAFTATGVDHVNLPASGHLPVPARLISPVHPAAPGEGVWHAVGRLSDKGIPAIYETFVRPDAVHTSYSVGVVWMDTTLLRATLYSGSSIPGGGPYPYTAPISVAASRAIDAVFNAGFRMADANGGYYTNGKTVLPLRNGAASCVIYKDGLMTVGQWGRDFTSITPSMESVRQNLDLIVDNGQVAAGVNNPNSVKWGKVVGNSFNVWRSGLGVTKDGAVVYVGGPALSVADLANTMVRAGAIRGMEFDINTDWVQYDVFSGVLGQPVTGGNATKLLASMSGNPSRYFQNWWTRDFYTMSLRPAPLGAPKS